MSADLDEVKETQEMQEFARQRGVLIKTSQVSVSSMSSGQSDSSEDNVAERLGRQLSLRDFGHKLINITKSSEFRERSHSDGSMDKVYKEDQPNSPVYPSLPNAVLEKMGLYGNGPRERLNDEETEQKFTNLALAFSIDSATIKDRCERQRRYRDQSETNLAKEIDKLKEKLCQIMNCCNDYAGAEMLSNAISQVDLITKAAALVSIAAERYGAVQHEERLTESVLVMVNHVQMLKQQRDSARRQLQYTKRVFQNSENSSRSGSPTSGKKNASPASKAISNGHRRASIAIATLPHLRSNIEKRIMRRTTELSMKASSLNKAQRPSRLELGVDLMKIREGQVDLAEDDNSKIENEDQEHTDDQGEEENAMTSSSKENLQDYEEMDITPRNPLHHKFRRIKQKYKELDENGMLHDFFCYCALMCFSIGILSLVSIYFELQYAKRGGQSHIFWYSTSDNTEEL